MSDLVDIANDVAALEVLHAVAKHKEKLVPSGKLFCSCGESIGAARLKAYPAASNCIDCARLTDGKRSR